MPSDLQTHRTKTGVFCGPVRKLISEHSDRILQGTKEQLAEVKEDMSIIVDSLQSVSMEIDHLKSSMNLLEVRCDDNEHYRHGLQADLSGTEDRLKDNVAELEEKIDRLEAKLEVLWNPNV